MEGPRLDTLDAEAAQAGAHLACGPRREGHGEDALRLLEPGDDPVRDPVRDRPGLARARAREDTQWARGRGRNLALLRVEPRENVVRAE
jgi:hypothetical protein